MLFALGICLAFFLGYLVSWAVAWNSLTTCSALMKEVLRDSEEVGEENKHLLEFMESIRNNKTTTYFRGVP